MIDVITALGKKGFVSTTNDPLPLEYRGEPAIRLAISTGSKPLSQFQKSLIADQLQIPVSFFLDMVSCTKNQADYDAEIKTWLHNNRAPR